MSEATEATEAVVNNDVLARLICHHWTKQGGGTIASHPNASKSFIKDCLPGDKVRIKLEWRGCKVASKTRVATVFTLPSPYGHHKIELGCFFYFHEDGGEPEWLSLWEVLNYDTLVSIKPVKWRGENPFARKKAKAPDDQLALFPIQSNKFPSED